MTDSNLPRHYSDDPVDPADNLDGYDYEESGVDAEFNPAAFAGAAAPAAEPVEEETAQQGLPLRGLAMILIVVALLLIGWGAFSLFGGDDDGDSDEVASSQQKGDAPAVDGQNSAEEATTNNGDGNSDRAHDSDRNNSDANHPDASNGDANNPEAGSAGTDNPGAPADVDRAATHITVLNNSPVQGLANDTANRLREGQWDAASVGNLPGTAHTFDESTVLYPSGDATAKAAAEQIAHDLGIKALPREAGDDFINDAQILEGPRPGGIIVITTNDLRR